MFYILPEQYLYSVFDCLWWHRSHNLEYYLQPLWKQMHYCFAWNLCNFFSVMTFPVLVHGTSSPHWRTIAARGWSEVFWICELAEGCHAQVLVVAAPEGSGRQTCGVVSLFAVGKAVLRKFLDRSGQAKYCITNWRHKNNLAHILSHYVNFGTKVLGLVRRAESNFLVNRR